MRIARETEFAMDAQPLTVERGNGTLVDQISGALRRAIVDGEYRVGDRLPSEAMLTKRFGVSRTVVREAIAVLRSERIVEARQGAGVFVLQPQVSAGDVLKAGDLARLSSILEILELRAPVEIEAAGLAAQRRSPVQEEAILLLHRSLENAARAGEPTTAADFALHLGIADATNNPRFRQFLEMLGQGVIPRSQLTGGGERSIVSLDQLVSEHDAIVTAIVNGEVEAARRAMQEHLLGSQRRYRSLLRNGPQHV
jgi:GntR family transcriptional regulator, transcriptional repressor for pyruvate dehydrogenase complex